jgi:hypothetical protein
MTTLAQLEPYLGPPQARPEPVDWEALHHRYGLRFPPDYRALTAHYPELIINQFLSIFHPASHETAWNDRMLDIPRSWAPRWLDSYTPTRGAINISWNGPFRVHPAPRGVFPWGITVNGDFCLWLTNVDPARWTVLIADREQMWHYRGSLTGFLHQLLSGQVTCPLFPDDFPAGGWRIEQNYSF